tara:strand:- start:2277 stop:3383 length:1107 start_codon:yes stop_codon:yes gene_type:complete
MKNLKKINCKLNLLIFVLICVTYSQFTISAENKIIFKINDHPFTSFDLEKRLEYLDFVGSNQNIDQDLIINDFISANLFYEYYKNLKNKNNFENKINEIFNDINTVNKKNKKEYNYEINVKKILENIKIDYIRKIVLENIFNSNQNNVKTSSDKIDLLYDIKIKYINIHNFEFDKLKNKFPNLKTVDYESILIFLNENNLEFFQKEFEINNINKINKKIRDNILNNNNFFIIQNEEIKSLIFIEKKFETSEGIIADLYSVRSQSGLDKNFLRCENLVNINDNQNIIHKEYKLVDLNDNLKNNLININDYVKFYNDDQNVYIVLCNIKFDEEILKNINFNKIINLNISEIENKFINKYSEIYNLIIFDE